MNILETPEKTNPQNETDSQKTYAEDFFEKHPKAQRTKLGLPFPCTKELYDPSHIHCEDQLSCCDCWNQIMPVPDQNDRQE